MASFEKLTQNITDTSQPIATRRAAVLEIAEIGGTTVLPFLLKALSDAASGVRREAANALQKCNFSEATHALVDALKKEDSDLTRWTLIEALGSIGTADALPALESLLRTEVSPLTRREVQKSVDLIAARHSEADVAETTSETSDPLGTQELSDSYDFELEQPTSDQATINQNVVESEDYPDELSPNSDELIIEDTTESLPHAEKAIPPNEEIETPIIVIEQAPETDETAPEESSDSATSSETYATEIKEDTDSSEDSPPSVKTFHKHNSTPALPVLVPNTSVVIYEQEDQKINPSVFAIMLRPNAYLSKQWVSRTRLYLVLFCLLAAATVALVYSQMQRRPRPPYLPSTEIAFVENPRHYLDAGSFFIQQSDYRSAIEMYELIRGIDSMDPVLYKNLGFAHFQENQYALAVEAYEFYLQARVTQPYQPFIAEAAYSSNGAAIGEKDSSDYKTYNTLGTAYKRLGHLHKARLAYETAIKIAPNEAEAYNNLARLYSDGYQQKHLLTEALAYAAVSLNSDVPSYHDTLGWIIGKSGRLNKATSVLEQAIRLQSDYVPAHYHLAEIVRQSKHPEKGTKIVQNALVKKMRHTRKLRPGILGVLSHIYETDSQKIPRFSSAFLNLRGIKK